jgi:hypothetical protein
MKTFVVTALLALSVVTATAPAAHALPWWQSIPRGCPGR